MSEERQLNVCPRCKGSGYIPDKPWKPGRAWMVCPDCENAAGLPEPEEGS